MSKARDLADSVAAGSVLADGVVSLSEITSASGVNLNFADNSKAIFGAGSDLQIYHDGASGASYISESGGGDFYISGENMYLRNGAGTKNFLVATQSADVKLYYNNAQKFATTSTGIDVTGTVVSDGLTVDAAVATITNADINNGATLRLDNATSSSSWGLGKIVGTLEYYLSADASTTEPVRAKIELEQSNTLATFPSEVDLNFYTTSANTLKKSLTLNSSGDISFYEDTGTTPKFYWDASAESLGIGTSSPSKAFVVSDGGAMGVEISPDDGGLGYSRILNYDRVTNVYEPLRIEAEDLRFSTGTTATEKVRITAGGELLVGKTSVNNSSNGTIVDPNGTIKVVRSSEYLLQLNRTTTDGEIARFQKDGTTVGSIGAISGDAYIGSAETGIRFNQPFGELIPFNTTTQASTDATITFGSAASRFKDLYLSGGVYLGGTGSANKLDDYEEGTWTPVPADASSGGNTSSFGTHVSTYTKIGNRVMLSMNGNNINTTGLTSGNALYIGGLPFTPSASGSGTIGSVTGRFTIQAGFYYFCSQIGAGSSRMGIYGQVSGGNEGNLNVGDLINDVGDLFITITYEAA